MSTMPSKTGWSRDCSIVLIQLYENEPCLYAMSSADYHNRNKRQVALETIATNIGVMRPGTTANEVKIKLNGLRTQYLDACSKVATSKKSGCSTDSTYIPSLWCFEMLSFLEGHRHHLKGTSNMESGPRPASYSSQSSSSQVVSNNSFDDTFESELLKQAEEENYNSDTNQSNENVLGQTLNFGKKTPAQKRQRKAMETSPSDLFFAEARDAMSTIKSRKKAETVEDAFDVYGKLVAAELRTLKNPARLRRLKYKILSDINNAQAEDEDSS